MTKRKLTTENPTRLRNLKKSIIGDSSNNNLRWEEFEPGVKVKLMNGYIIIIGLGYRAGLTYVVRVYTVLVEPPTLKNH